MKPVDPSPPFRGRQTADHAARSTPIANARVLTLPGWQGSGPGHWQTLWEAEHGDQRVEQSDWMQPLRGDWMARLEEVLLNDDRPAVLVAHSLGCLLVASWAAHSRHTGRVRAALLVAPPDLDRADTPAALQRWRPVARQPLPFASLVVLSSDDPFVAEARGEALARSWGSRVVRAGPRGHLNADSGLGVWPEGRQLLEEIARAGLPAP